MAYNITNLTSVSSFNQFAKLADAATNGWLFTMLLIGIFVVLVVNLRRNGIEKAVAGASFACLGISVILLYIGLINILAPIMFFVMLAGTLLYIRFANPE